MRTRDELASLATAGKSLLPSTESLVDAGEQDRILAQILASPRMPRRPHRPVALLMVGAAAVAAAAAIASLALTGGQTSRTATRAQHHRGESFALAGYRFRLPAGYTVSADTCQFWSGASGQQPGTPVPVLHSFADSASADGGCLLAMLIDGNSTLPANATPVAVGSYKGFVAASPAGSQEALYVEIPSAQGNHYLALLSQGLATEQLISIAETGLPAGTAIPAQTCTADCG